jgi:hypothetical protein
MAPEPAALAPVGTVVLAPAGTTTLASAGTTSLLGEGTAALRERNRDDARAADWGQRANTMERGNGEFWARRRGRVGARGQEGEIASGAPPRYMASTEAGLTSVNVGG